MIYDFDDRFLELKNDKIFYYLLTGLTYTEIAQKYYHWQKYKFVYEVRKLLKEFKLQNRQQLAFFAVSKGLVDLDSLG